MPSKPLRFLLLSLPCLTQIRATPLSVPNEEGLLPGQSLVYERDDAAEVLPSSIFPGGSCKRVNTCLDPENPQAMSCEKNGYEGHRTVRQSQPNTRSSLTPLCRSDGIALVAAR